MANFDIVTKKRLDTRLNVSPENKEFIIDVSGAQVTQRREPAVSWSNSVINFNITPNSPSSVLDRALIIEVPVKYVFKRTGGLSNFLRPNRCGPRGFNYGIQSTNIIINGLSISQETQDIVHAQSHFNSPDNIVRGQTISPTWFSPDYCQVYNDLAPGTSNNTLADYDNSNRSRFGKGSYKMDVLLNTPNDAEVIVTYFEYLALSPATYDGALLPGLTNVTSLQLSFVLANLSRTFAVSGTFAEFTGYTVSASIYNTPQCHLQEISMPVYIQSPPIVTMSYTDIQRQESRGKVIDALATTTLSSNSYQLNTVPHSIIIYAKENKSAIFDPLDPGKQSYIPDAYGIIENIQINYSNQSAILSSASPAQLFQMSSRNGLDMTFDEFRGATTILNSAGPTITRALCGSLVCLSFGRDISANDPTSIPGTSINSNFQVRASVKNPNSFPVDYNLEILYIYEGIISCAAGSAFKYTSILTRDETLNIEMLEDDDVDGGKIDFKGILAKAKTGLKRAAPYLKPILKSAATTALDVGQEVGSRYIGDKGAQMARDLAKEVTGLGLQGGQLVSKSRMSRRV